MMTVLLLTVTQETVPVLIPLVIFTPLVKKEPVQPVMNATTEIQPVI